MIGFAAHDWLLDDDRARVAAKLNNSSDNRALRMMTYG